MKKQFVLNPYFSDGGMAMFATTDFRFDDLKIKIGGVYTHDKAAKGMFNGREIGFFTTNSGEKYLVFTDYSAKKIEIPQ